jgi:hypothetical protein
MKPALAGPALAAAAAVALFSYPGGAAPPPAPAGGTLAAAPESDARLAGSAVAELVRANRGRLPANGEELAAAVAALAARTRPDPFFFPAKGNPRPAAPHGFAQLPVVFSAVALDSGLTRPRLVLAAQLGADPPPSADQMTRPPPGGWGGGGFGGPLLNPVGATTPNLDGRLFLAANFTSEYGTDPRVKSVEFISWNTRRLKFDFGLIDYEHGKPELRLVDGIRCFTCHKNRGPILGADPWSNTAHNPTIRATADKHLWERTATTRLDGVYDGLPLLSTQAREVDGAVRRGADLACDREMFRLMTRSEDGRKGLALLFAAVARPGQLFAEPQLDTVFAASFPKFRADFVALQAATAPSLLADFNPAKLPSPRDNPHLFITVYDNHRSHGDHQLPSFNQPSNPRAFVRPPVRRPATPSALLTPARLARTVGLTEGDRAFLAKSLELAQLLTWVPGLPVVPAEVLAAEAFTGQAFADVMAGGPLPDREDFKDRFVAGLAAAVEKRKGHLPLAIPRVNYASGPNFAPKPGEEVKEVELVPTTACLRCHEVRPAGKRGTDPIPPLAFDPFDKAGREAWVKFADRKRAATVLGRILKRVGTDKDMPPEDAAEYELFRKQDPAAFDEVRRFLEAELRKVK